MRFILSSIVTALLAASCTADNAGIDQIDFIPPEGYRAVEVSEYTTFGYGTWEEYRQEKYPHPDWAEGDYDGDGDNDHARMWIREEGTGWLLMTYLSSRPDQPMELFKSERPPWSRVVATIPPGTHKTHKYYGIGPGGPDTTAVVVLDHDAIHLGWWESEGWVYVWDKKEAEFEQVWMY
jgi:hypothetical protein